MEVVFNFGGFYHSQFDDSIDSALEEESQEFRDSIDFKKVHIEVSKHITTQFEQFLSDEYDLDINLEFVSLDSPRFYNYSTDKILLNISKEDRIKMDLLVSNDSDVESTLKEYVKDTTTSKSGYIPFYNYNEVMAKINEDNESVYYQCLLDVLRTLDEDEYLDKTLDCLSESVFQAI